jgi:hypothetical protein
VYSDAQANNTLTTKRMVFHGASRHEGGAGMTEKKKGKGEKATGIEPETAIQTRDRSVPTPPANHIYISSN